MDDSNLPILLAQCKAYHSLEEVAIAIKNLIKTQLPNSFKIHVSLPYSYIEPLSKQFEAEQIVFGAEMLLDADEGSFTSTIAGKMLEQAKVKFVLIGTTQDRTSLSSGSEQLKNKIKAALEAKVPPFLCIGETWHEYIDKMSKEILTLQFKDCLEGFSPEQLQCLHIIYDAEWISSTPWKATSPELHEAYKVFKDVVEEMIPTNDQNNPRLILSVPAYSNDLAKLISSLQTSSHHPSGYSFGILGLSSEFLQPLTHKRQDETAEKSSKEPDVVEAEPIE